MIYSDHAKSETLFAPENEWPKIFYLMAVEQLTDPYRIGFLIHYCGV